MKLLLRTQEYRRQGIARPAIYTNKKSTLVDDEATFSEMDPSNYNYKTYDTSYFRHVAKRRGLFQSDAALVTDAATKE